MSDLATQPRLIEPGLRLLPAGTERYAIKGGGALILDIYTGDSLKIIDPQGRQRCEIAVIDRNGYNDPGILGVDTAREAAELSAMLAGTGNSATRIQAALQARKIQSQNLQAIHLFAADSLPGEQQKFTVQRDAVCIIAAPGGPMPIDGHNPPSDLIVFIARAQIEENPVPVLPDPLAEPRLDIRIDRRTAQAYEVHAGEFIQIIDVEGRECSDFQAFTLAGLDQGVERCLNATTTRTLMGAAYPGPGLFARFFDMDMQPLVEVFRDTVGRHDTFNLACTARYYEDLGYPGHVNCSDNFNSVLRPFGVNPRLGWEAINFFYNTNLDDNNQLYLDEPWSRPGDYVLLKAYTGLICVSSACPCDVDAANGWNPTDIHVRIYPAKNTFSKAIAYRMTTDADPELTRETAFHPRTSGLTRNFNEYRGYWLPTAYNNHGTINEYWACRERAVVIDLSPLRKFEVVGPDAEALLQWTVTRNMRRLSVGQVAYTAMCYDTGGMIDDGTVLRLGADNFRWICGDDYCGIWLRQQAQEKGYRAWVKSSTDQMHNIAVQGPKSRDILKQIIRTSAAQPAVDEIDWFRLTIGRVGSFDGIPVVVSRTGYTGELGYEIWCHPRHAVEVWDAVWEAGRPYDMAPLGLDALDMLRIEAGLIFYGAEFCDQTDPFEAGIGFTVPLKTKEDDFIGREALIRRKANPRKKLVGLELAGEEAGASGDSVHVGRQQVGDITSATRSPILRRNIALCRMAVEHAEAGTEVEVGKMDGHQKRIPARVVSLPFYDPEKARPRM